ncbi:unnamed protein product, partial [Iphiclides podalirius]
MEYLTSSVINKIGDWNSGVSSTTDILMTGPLTLSLKRPLFGRRYGAPPAKRAAPAIRLDAGFKWNLQALANAADAVESGGKSPVSALNELGVRVSYAVLQQGGPAHCPSFTVAVTVADMTFEGWGHSKREARAAAARTCLSALLARAGRLLPAPPRHQDFTSDEPPRKRVSEFQCLEMKTKQPGTEEMSVDVAPAAAAALPATSLSPGSVLFGAPPQAAPLKSPINTLYENYPGLSFVCTYGDGSPLDSMHAPLQLSHSMRFKVVCQIKDQRFEGYGSSKKLAKLAAARAALGELGETRLAPPKAAPSTQPLPQLLADHVARLINEKFTELMRGDLVHSKRKVLAGIVITVNYSVDSARVIAVTTGTKCVSGEHMSVTGMALNDCHAEVAARRCLQRFLYAQLLMYATSSDPRRPLPDSDLEPLPGGGFQLRPDRQLHLYVSTAPCGDGRIFSPHEHTEAEPDKHPNSPHEHTEAEPDKHPNSPHEHTEAEPDKHPNSPHEHTEAEPDKHPNSPHEHTEAEPDKHPNSPHEHTEAEPDKHPNSPHEHTEAEPDKHPNSPHEHTEAEPDKHPNSPHEHTEAEPDKHPNSPHEHTEAEPDKHPNSPHEHTEAEPDKHPNSPHEHTEAEPDKHPNSPHEHTEAEPDKHPNRLARGQLRTKIESGEGTIPVKNCNNFVQTWDGVLQGERLLTMSCSDKAARWCVVGLQGALLGRLMRPVYLHSLVLGSLLHPQHMYR